MQTINQHGLFTHTIRREQFLKEVKANLEKGYEKEPLSAEEEAEETLLASSGSSDSTLPYTCPPCGELYFSRLNGLHTHWLVRHRQDSNIGTNTDKPSANHFKACFICRKVMANQDSVLTIHLKQKHKMSLQAYLEMIGGDKSKDGNLANNHADGDMEEGEDSIIIMGITREEFLQ